MIGNLFESIRSIIEALAESPVDKTVDIITKPGRDALEIIDGLTESEIRGRAIIFLGIDVVSGMGVSDLLDWYILSKPVG